MRTKNDAPHNMKNAPDREKHRKVVKRRLVAPPRRGESRLTMPPPYSKYIRHAAALACSSSANTTLAR
jgi:hypothetical protein